MRKLFFLLVLLTLCGSAWATVPVNSCTYATVNTTADSCTIATVSPHHTVLTFFLLGKGGISTPTVTYTDSMGNTGTAANGCYPGGTPCTGPFALYNIPGNASFEAIGLFALSTGSNSGSVTFSLSTSVMVTNFYIYTAEYGEDFVGVDNVVVGVTTPFN